MSDEKVTQVEKTGVVARWRGTRPLRRRRFRELGRSRRRRVEQRLRARGRLA